MRKILLIVFIWLATSSIYYPALTTYFSQDDFFHFKVSQTDGTLGGFTKLFKFRPFSERKIAFYRPVTRELPFNLSYHFFGLNPVPLRTLSFLLVFANIYLTHIFIVRLFKSEATGLLTAFFVGISSVNTASLYYLAGGIQTLGVTFFILLTLVLFNRHKILSFLTFLLALGSEEQAVVLPVLLTGLIFVQFPLKTVVKKTFTQLYPHFLIVLSFVAADYLLIGFSKTEAQYHLNFSPKTFLNSLSWYAVWSLGLPEMLIDFVLPGLKLKPALLHYWPHYYKPVLFGFIVSITLIVESLLGVISRIFKDKRFWLLLIWFGGGLLPVLFLPQHKSTHYLYPVLPAFWGAVSFVTVNAYARWKEKLPTLSNITAGLLLGGIILLNVASALAGRELYWAASRGRLAEKLVKLAKSQYPVLPINSAIYYTNDPTYPFIAKDWGGTSKQAAYVLNNEDALQLLYNDPTLKVFYEDTGGVPSDFKGVVYPLVARLN